MQRSALCKSRRELSNEYLLAKFGFDPAENEPDFRLISFVTIQGFDFALCIPSAPGPRYAEVSRPVCGRDVEAPSRRGLKEPHDVQPNRARIAGEGAERSAVREDPIRAGGHPESDKQ